jgi:integrase
VSSIIRRPNGHRWISYKFNGKRHTIRLGKTDDDLAAAFQERIDALVEYVGLGLPIPTELNIWLSNIDERFHRVLVVAGLAESRGPATLDGLLKAHEQSLVARSRKPSTLMNNRVVYANILAFFKPHTRIRGVNQQHAEKFRMHLLSAGGRDGAPLAKATVSNRLRRARAVFAYAIRNGWLTTNPFREIATGGEWNYTRDHYIMPQIFHRILDMTADRELRLLLAMVRFCGLRCPSEIHPLRWAHVNWEDGVFIVHSSKTELYGDGGRREVPVFAPLLPYLLAAAETRGDSELMFPNHQTSGAAITGRLAVLCRKAGEVLWPKPMVNLRASAIHDAMTLNSDIYTVAPWFGHSPTISLRHYNRVVKERKARQAYDALRGLPISPAEAHEATRQDCS